MPVLAGDTEATLAARVLAQEHILYPAVLRAVAGGDVGPVAGNGALINLLPGRAALK